jgi:hypothetical protein
MIAPGSSDGANGSQSVAQGDSREGGIAARFACNCAGQVALGTIALKRRPLLLIYLSLFGVPASDRGASLLAPLIFQTKKQEKIKGHVEKALTAPTHL